MLPIALSRDILAIRCIGKYIIVGVGNQLKVFSNSNFELLRTIDTFHDDVIHNIVKSCDKIIVFGGRHMSIFELTINSGKIIIEKKISHVFEDWIIAAEFFTHDSDDIYILFSHNNLYLFNTSTKKWRNVWCEERCILYGGYLSRENSEEIIVFSCTVFQEILLWKVNNKINLSSDAPILHRLKGHKGVIFSVFYDPKLKFITSTSDDRTIRFWKIVENDLNSVSGTIEWENIDICLVTTMFGHTARVWKSIIVENNIISIGEDSLICIWSLTGALHDKIIAHRGAPIWSIEISPDNSTIITGGGDGAVNTWSSNTLKNPSLTPEFTYPKKTPKFVSYLNSGALVVFIDGGELLLYSSTPQNNHQDQPEATIIIPKLKTYCLMQISPNREKIALASQDGYILIFEEESTKKPLKLDEKIHQKVMNSKIFSLQWLNNSKLLISGAFGALKILNLSQNSLQNNLEFTLPQSKEPWTTSSIISSKLLICGDRAGSITVFQLDLKTPKQIFPKIHGRLGVQSLGIFGEKIISTGRDGTLRYYRVLEDDFGEFLKPLHWKKMPMEWVSRSIQLKDDIFILGFKEIEFMIYSTRLDRLILRIICGGGHRSWDCIFNDKIINFVCIKDKQVHLLENISCDSSKTIIPGFHSKEIHSLAILPISSISKLILSASEDCSIRISALNPTESLQYELKPLDVYDGHISNIKKIEIVNIESSDELSRYLIFSAGGRAQLKVWEINIHTDGDVVMSDDVVMTEITSFMLRGSDRDRRKCLQSKNKNSYFLDPETRFMDMSGKLCPENEKLVILFVACSDGFIRIFFYDIEGMRVTLVSGISYFNRCILKIHCFLDNNDFILISMATDGFINLWNFSCIVGEGLRNKGDYFIEGGVEPFGRWRAHQSGINGYDFMENPEGKEYFIATGGDDNKIHFSVFEILDYSGGKKESRMINHWESSAIHSAQITGIRFLPNNQLLTTAIDQRVVLFDYNYSNGKLSVEPRKILHTFVSDLQGLTICNNPDNCNEILAFVYGQGLEVLLHEQKN